MQLTLTISVAILLGAKSYDEHDDFKFGSHAGAHATGNWNVDQHNHATQGNMGGQHGPMGGHEPTVNTADGEYGRGGSNYDTRLTEDYSPCGHGCVGKRFHSWQEHTWKDNAQEDPRIVGDKVYDHEAPHDNLHVNSGSAGNGKTKARRPTGGLWDEMPAIGNQDAGSRHGDGSMTDRTARPPHQKETNQEMMEVFTGVTSTDIDATTHHRGWGTHDFVDDGGHKGSYDDGTGYHTDSDGGPGGGRAWGSYESTDSADWAEAWAHEHVRRQYDKSGVPKTDALNTHWGPYPLETAANEDQYRQVMSELHQNGGAQTYTVDGMGPNKQQESGKESSEDMTLEDVEHFSWGIVPELAMDETARYFNGETWPRTQTRYRYSFQDWGTGSRAGTLFNQIHNSKPRTENKEADEDQHQYEWGKWDNDAESTTHGDADLGNRPGLFANVGNGGDQTVYTPRLSYSWTKRKYESLNATTENGFYTSDTYGSGPAWEWGTFNHEGAWTNPNDRDSGEEPDLTETIGASHRNWDIDAGDWASGKGPTGYALTTAIGDGKGWNTNDAYGYGTLDDHRTWRKDGARKV